MATQTLPAPAKPHDTFPINGTDYIEFYVGNAKQASLYYRAAFGFKLVAYRGPETGTRDRASYVLQQGKVRFVLTTPIRPDGDIARHIHDHGDGVKDLALWVNNANTAYAKAIKRGAVSVREPEVLRDEHGEVVIAAIRTYGETIHSLVERRKYKGAFLPGFVPVEPAYQGRPVGLKYVDHCVGNVELGAMNQWVRFYEDVLGFYNLISFDDKAISTEYSALMSKVVSNGNGRIKFPLNEPAAGRKKSQIDEYLEFYRGPGVQHIALETDDIVKTVTELRKNGRRVPARAVHLLRHRARPRGPYRRGHRAAAGPRHPRRSRRRGVSAADLQQTRRGPADGLLRGHPAQGRPELRGRQLQGAVRGHGARAGPAREPLMPFYHTLGQVPRKRHTVFRKPDGALYAEELLGHEGFSGTSALLYHVYPPTTVKAVKRLRDMVYERDPDRTLRHRHFRTSRVEPHGSPTLDRTPLLFNRDIAMLYVEPDRARRTLLPQRAGRRGGVRVQGQRRARDRSSATCRSARATTW